MKCEVWSSLADVLRESQAWDDLWQRSDTSVPSACAAPLRCWVEYFFPKSPLRAVVVREGDRLIAALPIVVNGRWPKLGQLPFNDWMPGGMLLLDPHFATPELGDLLVEGMSRLPCSAFGFRNVPWKSTAWQCLLDAVVRRRLPLVTHGLHEVGLVNLRRSWADIDRQFSGNHRRHMRKALRRAEREGGVAMQIVERCTPEELERTLRTGFEIEARGWKGQEGTAILQQPGMFDFVLKQGVELLRNDQVRLVLLKHHDQLVAYEYCWKAKGQLLTPKIAYDEDFSSISPGQLLIQFHMQHLVESGEFDQVDFSGPITDSTRKWCTSFYEAGTAVIGQPGLVGRAIVAAYAWRRARKLRKQAKSKAAANTVATQSEAAAEETAESEMETAR